jgi:tRNA/rRNA methyltransferase
VADMSFWTYILHCADRSYYIGHTDDLDRRIAEHQSGAIRGYTHERRPVELVWADEFPTRAEAQAAEIKIKAWSRAKKEALIAENWDRLKRLAIPPGERTARASASLGMKGLASPRDAKDMPGACPTPSFPRLRSGKADLGGSGQATRGPAIILVRPQLGENIGKAARAMLNFGLTDLRLVAPRDGWPNPSAGPAASGADVVLERARVFASVAEAVADCAHVYATTVRKRGLVVPVVSPEEAGREMHANDGPSAILFGAERSGLETDEVALAGKIVTVPVNPDFRSLNLAQAVILIAYEWSKFIPSDVEGHVALAVPTEGALAEPRAPHAHLEGLIGQLFEALAEADYFHPPHRTEVTKHTIRTILTKAPWSSREIQALRGIVRALAEPRRR